MGPYRDSDCSTHLSLSPGKARQASLGPCSTQATVDRDPRPSFDHGSPISTTMCGEQITFLTYAVGPLGRVNNGVPSLSRRIIRSRKHGIYHDNPQAKPPPPPTDRSTGSRPTASVIGEPQTMPCSHPAEAG